MKKKTAVKRKHECFDQVNSQLAEHNTELDFRSTFNMSTGILDFRGSLVVGTSKIDSKARGAAKTVVASHCPFCGIKLKTAR